MSKLRTIRDEIDRDILGRGYAGPPVMTDQQVADDGSIEYRTRPTDLVSPEKVLTAIEETLLNSRVLNVATSKAYIDWLLAFANGVPLNDVAVKARLDSIFDTETVTLAALEALRTEPISRWVELGVGEVHAGDIDGARRLP